MLTKYVTFIFYSEEVLLQWLETLEVFGISIIKSCGLEQGCVKELAERVAFLKKTQYGYSINKFK